MSDSGISESGVSGSEESQSPGRNRFLHWAVHQ